MIFSNYCAALRECCVLCAVCSIERVQSRRSAQRMRGATSNTAIDLRAGAAFYNDTHRFYVRRWSQLAVSAPGSECSAPGSGIWSLRGLFPMQILIAWDPSRTEFHESRSGMHYAATSLGKWRIKKCTRCDLLMSGTERWYWYNVIGSGTYAGENVVQIVQMFKDIECTTCKSCFHPCCGVKNVKPGSGI